METIKVQFVNQPKEGKKKGSIKTEDGRYFDVWPNMLSQFSRGESYEITTESREWQGKQYYTIKTAAQVHGNGSSAPATNGSNGNGNYSADRSARIERQHSQDMAIRYLQLLQSAGKLPEDTKTAYLALVDWFQRDIGKSPEKPKQEPEPVIAETEEGYPDL